MAIREIAALVPVSLNLAHAHDVRALAVQLESQMAPVLRTVQLAGDWIEHRQLALTGPTSYEIVDETVIFADAALGAITVTLPAADLDAINRDVHVKKTDSTATAVTITPRGTDTIDGAASLPIITEGQSFHLISNGLGLWRILSTVAASGGGGPVVPATATPIIVNFTAAAVGVSVKYAREDHRHKLDSTIDAIGADVWTGSHQWSPDSNLVPIKVSKTASLTSLGLLRVEDTDATPLFVVDNVGLVGVNCEPDALTTIQGGGSANTITSGLIGWYKADTLTASLADGANVVTWMDSSGAGNHLTATGCTITDGVSAVRPKYNAAGTSKGMPNLPTVSFEGVLSGDMGFFTLTAGGTLTLSATPGWTIAFIIRDYSNIASDSYPLGANLYGGGGDNGDALIKNVNAASNTRWDTSNGGVAKNFCGLYSHTPDGDVNEIIVLRCDTTALGSALRCWVDGTLKTATGDTKTISHIIRYIGRVLSSVGNPTGVYGKALAELMIFNVKVSDADVATLNSYLANRRDSTGSTYDLTRWKSAGGTTLSRVDSLGQFGYGVAVPLAPVHVILTAGAQQRLGYDASNYHTTTVGATGDVALTAAGTASSFTLTQGAFTDYNGAIFDVGGTLTGLGDIAMLAAQATAGINSGRDVYILSGSGSGGGVDGQVILRSGGIAGLPEIIIGPSDIHFWADGAYRFRNPSITTFNGELKFNILTANRTYDFPDASGTIALTSGFPVGANPTGTVGLATVNGSATTFLRSDGAPPLSQAITPTWTNVHTFTARSVHELGITLGKSGVAGDGRINSVTPDGAGVTSILLQPSVALSADATRWTHRFLDSTGTYGLRMDGLFAWSFLGNTGSNLAGAYIDTSSVIGEPIGISFTPLFNASSGATLIGKANSIVGGQFLARPNDNVAPAGYVFGGVFTTRINSVTSGNVPIGFVGGAFCPADILAANSGKTFAQLGGWRVFAALPTAKNTGTFTTVYGGYIENQTEALSGTAYTDLRGLIIEEMTGGATTNVGIELRSATAAYKAITIRDANTVIRSSAAATLTFDATTVENNADFKLMNAGNGLYIKEGTNATSGVATLVLGTIVVNTTKVTANSRIHLTVQVLGTVAVATAIAVTARTAGTSFTITSANATDTSTVAWAIIEPA